MACGSFKAGHSLPGRVESEEELEEMLSRPTPETVKAVPGLTATF